MVQMCSTMRHVVLLCALVSAAALSQPKRAYADPPTLSELLEEEPAERSVVRFDRDPADPFGIRAARRAVLRSAVATTVVIGIGMGIWFIQNFHVCWSDECMPPPVRRGGLAVMAVAVIPAVFTVVRLASLVARRRERRRASSARGVAWEGGALRW